MTLMEENEALKAENEALKEKNKKQEKFVFLFYEEMPDLHDHIDMLEDNGWEWDDEKGWVNDSSSDKGSEEEESEESEEPIHLP